MEPNKFSSEHIKNECITPTYETSSYEDCLETKIQANFYKSDQIFEHPEEELIYSIKQQHQESK